MSKFTDDLKSCKKCNIVWQTATILVEPYKKGGYSYYQDFPSYGLKKRVCPRCKPKEREVMQRVQEAISG